MQAHIDKLGQRIHALVRSLARLGYRFDCPDEVFPGPEHDAARSIEQIELAVGTLPLAVKLFWLRVGSVDLTGSHADWPVPGYLDQLIVYPASYALEELQEYLNDKEERDRYGYFYAVPIAPDYFHKAEVSGGKPYSIAVPAMEDDPPLLDAPVAETFLQHISRALDLGGFPGLEKCTNHNWPVSRITQGDA